MQKSTPSFFDEMQLNVASAGTFDVRQIYADYQYWLKNIPHDLLDRVVTRLLKSVII